eukprot:jgi/Ulvmu1/11371/UM075_0033.1
MDGQQPISSQRLARAREINRGSQARYRRRLKDECQKLEERVALLQDKIAAAQAHLIASNRENQRLHYRVATALERIIDCIRNNNSSPPPPHHTKASAMPPGVSGFSQSTPRNGSRHGTASAAPRPLSLSSCVRVQLDSAGPDPMHLCPSPPQRPAGWPPVPAAAVPYAAPAPAACVTAVLCAEDVLRDGGSRIGGPAATSPTPVKTLTAWLQARQQQVLAAADVPVATLRWVLQTPYAAGACEKVSVALPLRHDECAVSHAIFELASQLEGSFLIAGSTQPITATGASRVLPSELPHATSVLLQRIDVVLTRQRDSTAAGGCALASSGPPLRCAAGVAGSADARTAVTAAAAAVCRRYCRLLPPAYWLQACSEFLLHLDQGGCDASRPTAAHALHCGDACPPERAKHVVPGCGSAHHSACGSGSLTDELRSGSAIPLIDDSMHWDPLMHAALPALTLQSDAATAPLPALWPQVPGASLPFPPMPTDADAEASAGVLCCVDCVLTHALLVELRAQVVEAARSRVEEHAPGMPFPDGPGLREAAREYACSLSLMRLACVGLTASKPRRHMHSSTPLDGAWKQLQPLARLEDATAGAYSQLNLSAQQREQAAALWRQWCGTRARLDGRFKRGLDMLATLQQDPRQLRRVAQHVAAALALPIAAQPARFVSSSEDEWALWDCPDVALEEPAPHWPLSASCSSSKRPAATAMLSPAPARAARVHNAWATLFQDGPTWGAAPGHSLSPGPAIDSVSAAASWQAPGTQLLPAVLHCPEGSHSSPYGGQPVLHMAAESAVHAAPEMLGAYSQLSVTPHAMCADSGCSACNTTGLCKVCCDGVVGKCVGIGEAAVTAQRTVRHLLRAQAQDAALIADAIGRMSLVDSILVPNQLLAACLLPLRGSVPGHSTAGVDWMHVARLADAESRHAELLGTFRQDLA